MLPAILTVVMLALGGTGLYLALPGGRRNLWGLAGVLLAAAAGAFLGLVVPLLTGEATTGWFIALSLIGAFGAIRMITHTKAVYSAIYFILVIVAVTGLLILMSAEFAAAALVIIYAGAILVTYLFVIMLAQEPGPMAYDTEARAPLLGCVAGFVLLAIIASRLLFSPAPHEPPEVLTRFGDGDPLQIGTRLLTNYVIAIQIAGVLLLAAMVGAIAVARRKPAAETEGGRD